MKDNNHLDREQIVISVVDETALPETAGRHLAACPVCKAERKALETDLARLGQLGERFVPVARRRVVRLDKVANKRRRPWLYGLPVAAAAALVLVLWLAPFDVTRPSRTAVRGEEMLNGNGLLILEINRLAENPFSRFQRFVIGESPPVSDEEFLDFLIPDDEAISHKDNKGGLLC